MAAGYILRSLSDVPRPVAPVDRGDSSTTAKERHEESSHSDVGGVGVPPSVPSFEEEDLTSYSLSQTGDQFWWFR